MPGFDTGLQAYWFTFPDDPRHPLGVGVTAWSEEDADGILDAAGVDFLRTASSVRVSLIDSPDALQSNHVRVNMGPIVVRGIWYPFVGMRRPP